MAILAAPCAGSSTGFISPDLSTDPSYKSGYDIAPAAGSPAAGPHDCNGTATHTVPISVGLSGQRGVATSSRQVIFYDMTGAAAPEAAVNDGGAAPLQ